MKSKLRIIVVLYQILIHIRPCRCCASCATGPASAPTLPLSVHLESRWCQMAAAAARSVPGSGARPAQRCCPATAREECTATTAPASPGSPASASVSGVTAQRLCEVRQRGGGGGETTSVRLQRRD